MEHQQGQKNPTTNMLSDTANWMLVSGNFIATGGEKYMTIGNFHNPANTNTQVVSGGIYAGAYYYIDDVSVVDCTNDGVGELGIKNEKLGIYPNPSEGELRITLRQAQGTELGIKEGKIYDVVGECVYSFKITTLKTTIDISSFAKGIYFV